jgi:hypothetical protein
MMMKRTLLLIGMISAFAMILTGCLEEKEPIAEKKNASTNDITFRYKITINIDTPDGEKSASAVREVYIKPVRKGALPQAVGTKRVKGEAVIIPVDSSNSSPKIIFAIMDESGSNDDLIKAFGMTQGGHSLSGIKKIRDIPIGTSHALDNAYWPQFVTFTDINDPKTVTFVDPYDLSAYFGEGAKVSEITITMTDEEVTKEKVKTYLPWISEYFNKRFDNQRFGTIRSDYPLANSFSSGLFVTKKDFTE